MIQKGNGTRAGAAMLLKDNWYYPIKESARIGWSLTIFPAFFPPTHTHMSTFCRCADRLVVRKLRTESADGPCGQHRLEQISWMTCRERKTIYHHRPRAMSNSGSPSLRTEPNLRFSAKIFGFLRKSAVSSQGEGVNLRKSAVFCENLRFGLSLSP